MWSRGKDDVRNQNACYQIYLAGILLICNFCYLSHVPVIASVHTHTHVYIRAVYRRGVESARRDAAHVWHGMATLELQLGHIDTARDLFREVAKSSRSSSGGMKKRVFLALLCHVSHMLFCL